MLAAALGQTRADFAEEMSRALAMETYNVAYTSDATARRQRRCLLRAFAATVACERVPLLAWRAAVYECRQERRLASESAISSAAAVAATAKAAAKKPAPLPTGGTFRVVPIKGILAEVAALYQVIVPSHCIYIAFRPYQNRSSSTVEDPCSSNLDSKGIRCMDRRVKGLHSGWSVTLHAHLTVIAIPSSGLSCFLVSEVRNVLLMQFLPGKGNCRQQVRQGTKGKGAYKAG